MTIAHIASFGHEFWKLEIQLIEGGYWQEEMIGSAQSNSCPAIIPKVDCFAAAAFGRSASLRGGICSQPLIGFSEFTDSTMVRNAKNGYKGKFFIQFSFSFRCCRAPLGSGTKHPVPLCSQNYEDKRRCMGRLTAGRLLDVELTP